jgi:hypothetical protein
MSSLDGLRIITMGYVPIDVQLENLPKPTRITGFDLSKKDNHSDKNKTDTKTKKTSPFFTFTEAEIRKKVE